MQTVTDNQDAERTTDTALDTLLHAAVLAPSGDNTQPWQFTANRSEQAIYLDIDPSRDPSPMNAGQSMARISLGAALENMIQTCRHNQWEYQTRRGDPGTLQVGKLGEFHLCEAYPPGMIEPALRRRVSNRRRYDGRPIQQEVLGRLYCCNEASTDTRVNLLTDPAKLETLVEMIAQADSLMLGTRPIRNAFLDNVRFDARPNDPTAEGLSMGSLELGAVDRISLRVMHRLPPPDGLMKALGARRTFARVAKSLAGSASGICLISSNQHGPEADLEVGRTWQRVWLQMEREQLASQPMMSLLVLENIFANGDATIFSERDRTEVKTLIARFRDYCSELFVGTPRAMMRFGFADSPTARVGRLPVDQLTVDG